MPSTLTFRNWTTRKIEILRRFANGRCLQSVRMQRLECRSYKWLRSVSSLYVWANKTNLGMQAEHTETHTLTHTSDRPVLSLHIGRAAVTYKRTHTYSTYICSASECAELMNCVNRKNELAECGTLKMNIVRRTHCKMLVSNHFRDKLTILFKQNCDTTNKSSETAHSFTWHHRISP